MVAPVSSLSEMILEHSTIGALYLVAMVCEQRPLKHGDVTPDPPFTEPARLAIASCALDALSMMPGLEGIMDSLVGIVNRKVAYGSIDLITFKASMDYSAGDNPAPYVGRWILDQWNIQQDPADQEWIGVHVFELGMAVISELVKEFQREQTAKGVGAKGGGSCLLVVLAGLLGVGLAALIGT